MSCLPAELLNNEFAAVHDSFFASDYKHGAYVWLTNADYQLFYTQAESCFSVFQLDVRRLFMHIGTKALLDGYR